MKRKVEEAPVVRNNALLASITPIGIEFKRNTLFLGENYCRAYAIVKYPGEVDYGWYSRLTNIPGTIVAINYRPVDNGQLISAINSGINRDRGAAASTKSPLERQRKEKAADDAEKMLRQMDQNSEVVGEFSTVILVLSRDEDDFQERCKRTESIANTLGCKIRALPNLQKEAYQHLSPTYPQVKQIAEITNRLFPVSTFVGGFPFAASGFNDGDGFYLGKDADGGMIIYDHWKRDKSRTNSNITIIGASGTGKSTALKHIIASEFARGSKIIVIDPEGEYKEMCQNSRFCGDWIDVAGGRGGLINPLQVRPSPQDDDETKEDHKLYQVEDLHRKSSGGVSDLALHIKNLEVFFRLYLPSLGDRHRAILSRSLIEVYALKGIDWDTDITKLANTDFPVIGDLYELLKEKINQPELAQREVYEDLFLLLESSAIGADRGLWNGHTTIGTRSDFVVLDTKSMENLDSNTLCALYFNILSWCWQQMTVDPTKQVILVADECWRMIDPKVPQSLLFLRNVEKRARKYEGSIVVSSQNIIDFLDPSIKIYGQEVLDSPSVKFIFGMDGKSLLEVRDTFNLNEAQFDLVASKTRGIALMKIGSQAVKVKFQFSDERLALFGKAGGR